MLRDYDAIRTLADVPDLHGDSPALICGERTISYDDLSAAANRVANALLELGISRGARVAFVGFDTEKSYELLFGCARAGLVFVPVNWKLGIEEIEFILNDSEAEVLFVTPELAQLARAWRASCPRLKAAIAIDGRVEGFSDYLSWRDAAAPVRPTVESDPEWPVAQVYTSGTSGQPKGVVLAHRGFIELVREIVRAGDEFIGWKPGDVALLALPTFHVGGLWWAVHNLINRSSGVVLKAFSGGEALSAIERHRITKLAFVPAMLRFLLSEPALATADLSSVELVVYGGSPMPAPLLDKAQSRFACDFAQNYGLSETTNMAIFMPPSEHAALAGAGADASATGRPLHGVQVRIVDRQRREVARGESGEIVFRTPSRMLEYWKRPQETAETLADGWLHTGDAGYIDANGYVHITDRIKDLIISAGENISAAELEQALLTHPQIEEVAVIGIPDRRWGEVPIAYVVETPGSALTKNDIMTYARSRIAPFKMLYDAILIDRLPRNATGKILKRVLREPHWSDQPRRVN